MTAVDSRRRYPVPRISQVLREAEARDKGDFALVCPGCIRLRFSPIHLFNRLVGICDGRGW